MKRFGYFYGNKGHRKYVMFFDNAFMRNCYAQADVEMGWRVRKFDRLPKVQPAYIVCW